MSVSLIIVGIVVAIGAGLGVAAFVGIHFVSERLLTAELDLINLRHAHDSEVCHREQSAERQREHEQRIRGGRA